MADEVATLPRFVADEVRRPHHALDNRTPMEVYRGVDVVKRAAA